MHGKGGSPSQFLTQPFFDTLRRSGDSRRTFCFSTGRRQLLAQPGRRRLGVDGAPQGDSAESRDARKAHRARRDLDGRLRRAPDRLAAARFLCRRRTVAGLGSAPVRRSGRLRRCGGLRAQRHLQSAAARRAVWIDLGASDPFREATLAYAHEPACLPTSSPAATTPRSGTRHAAVLSASSRVPAADPFPKIELHVHLEGTVRPDTLRAIAKRNDYALPDDLESLYRFRDFAHFIEVWILTTNALRTEEDFRQVVVDYAEEAAAHGAVYLEGIFSPAERVARGVGWDEIFSGYCDGAQEAREKHGVEVRLTPDISRGATLEQARAGRALLGRSTASAGSSASGSAGSRRSSRRSRTSRHSRSRARSGSHPSRTPERRRGRRRSAVRSRSSAPTGSATASARSRTRVSSRELAGRGTVLDVCPLSNLRTGVVRSLEEHPLPQLVAAGVRCSISTDDPAMFDTDLTRDYEAAASLGRLAARRVRGRRRRRALRRRDARRAYGRSASLHALGSLDFRPWRLREKRSRSGRSTRCARRASTAKTCSASTATCSSRAASRSAATSSTARARSPARSTPAAATKPPRSASRRRWARRTSGRRSTATWASTSCAASSRGGSSRSTWAARTARRTAATATSTWPTRSSG